LKRGSDGQKAGRQFAKPLEVRDAFVSLFWIPPIPLPALGLFQPVLDDPAGYTAGDGEDNRILLGALLELLLIIAIIGTAVVLFPVLRRQNEILALG